MESKGHKLCSFPLFFLNYKKNKKLQMIFEIAKNSVPAEIKSNLSNENQLLTDQLCTIKLREADLIKKSCPKGKLRKGIIF